MHIHIYEWGRHTEVDDHRHDVSDGPSRNHHSQSQGTIIILSYYSNFIRL